MSNAERDQPIKQKELGRLKREMYLTDAEHEALKLKLGEIMEGLQ